MLQKILGINWKTTLPGILAIIAVVGKIGLAYRTKDFGAIFSNGQELITDITVVLAGIGLIAAKASNVTGVGTQAATVDENGKLVTAQGDVVGKQPS
jgi:hypothetical protein